MCGIVGYLGPKNAQTVLVNGLKRLEYRGYDSAGVVTIGVTGKATLSRAVGKVVELEKAIDSDKTDDSVGIGHTRWATHGVPSERNAHPHKAGEIYLVHNGIIENYKELKTELKNHKFVSDTDSEVLAALIDSFYDSSTSLADATAQALKLVTGTYGIAVISKRNPEEVVVARLGSPLIIGLSENETVIASDASALVEHTDQAIYLKDGEMAVCHAGSVELSDLAREPVSKQVETIAVDLQAIQKQNFNHFLIKEIHDQPETLQATLRGRLMLGQNTVKLGGLNMSDDTLRSIEHIVIVGCGTAYYAGLLASYYLEELVGDVTIEVAVASELRYRSFYLPENTVALVVSQSGETADTLAALREIKARGIKTLGIVNAVGSTIAREVDGGIYVHAGPEISVASTKAFTSQVSAMLLFALQLAQVKGVGVQERATYIKELAELPNQIESVLKSIEKETEKLAKQYASYDHALYLGRGTAYPAALEGALKLKELSYIQTDGVAAGELKHGSLALVDDRFFELFLLLDGPLLDKAQSNLSEVNARGGHVLAITNSNAAVDAETVLRVETSAKLLAPLVLNVVQQLFAYYVAVERGNDVDQPRNLAKSVTVE
jgi:glutamine---fructose-6-phosphate transaminase (isomerizing)